MMKTAVSKANKFHENSRAILRRSATFCALFILMLSAVQFANAVTYTVSSTDDSGTNTLRQAILNANATVGADVIVFTLAANSTIAPTSPLPAITDQLTISSGNGYFLDGSTAGPSGIGFRISAANCIVQGQIITRFEEAGIRIDGAANNTTLTGNLIGTNNSSASGLGNFNRGVLIVGTTGNTIGGISAAERNIISGNSGTGISITGGGSATIRGNYIGTDVAGTGDLGNTQDGVRIVDSSSSTIGGSDATVRNVIAGNGSSGVSIVQTGSTTSATGNTISANFIGVNVNGNTALPNNGSGVLITAASNTVGGATAGLRNIISGNSANGVSISSNFSTGNVVAGNYIGVGTDGTTAIANRDNGVQISNLANGNTVGGSGVTAGSCNGACNIIANNGDVANSSSARAGIFIDATGRAGNALRANSIFNNTGIGIDLSVPGVTANDASDADAGPNNTQNFPVVTSAETNGNIVGSLNSTANTTFAIDFFSNTVADGSMSEGRTFIGSTSVITDANGTGNFSYGTTATLTVGQMVTATATSTASAAQAINDTSEFSATRTVAASTAGANAGTEADVSPRPNGNGGVTSTDVSQVDRFQLGLDTDYMGNEFQRADCAPIATRGDGAVSATDVSQATRYQLGLDQPQTAGGPTTRNNRPSQNTDKDILNSDESDRNAAMLPRVVRIVNQTATPGSTVTVPLQVDAQGDESVYGFSVNFDTTRLTLQSITRGAAANNALFNTNPVNPAGAAGQVGFSINFGNATIAAGNNQTLATLVFTVAANAPAGATSIFFDDTPTIREVSNTSAQPVATTFADGAVTILGTTAAPASVSGRLRTASGAGISGASMRLFDARTGETFNVITNSDGAYVFEGVPVGSDYIITPTALNYSFNPRSRFFSLVENLNDVDFVGVRAKRGRF